MYVNAGSGEFAAEALLQQGNLSVLKAQRLSFPLTCSCFSHKENILQLLPWLVFLLINDGFPFPSLSMEWLWASSPRKKKWFKLKLTKHMNENSNMMFFTGGKIIQIYFGVSCETSERSNILIAHIWVGLGWVKLGWAGLGWVGLSWVSYAELFWMSGLGWVELDLVRHLQTWTWKSATINLWPANLTSCFCLFSSSFFKRIYIVTQLLSVTLNSLQKTVETVTPTRLVATVNQIW